MLSDYTDDSQSVVPRSATWGTREAWNDRRVHQKRRSISEDVDEHPTALREAHRRYVLLHYYELTTEIKYELALAEHCMNTVSISVELRFCILQLYVICRIGDQIL